MKTRRIIKWVIIAAVASVMLFVVLLLPGARSLPEGYTDAYFPRGGHRYIVAPGGSKKGGPKASLDVAAGWNQAQDQYSRSLSSPGRGTGYLPPSLISGGPDFMSKAFTPGANSCGFLM